MIIRHPFCFALVLALGVVSSVQARFTREVEQTFHVSADGQLLITTMGGDVTVVTGGEDTVQVRATQVFYGADDAEEADEVAKDLEFLIKQDGDTVTAHAKYQKSVSGWFNWGKRGVAVSFRVTVPERFKVKASTSGGDIEVANIIGRVDVRTSGGDIDLGRVQGRVDAVTSGGGIRVRAGSGQINVATSGGDIRIEHAEGDVQASTSGGNVHIEHVDGTVNASSSGGNVSARFTSQLVGSATLSTSGGNVTAWLPVEAAVFLDASTSGGSVKTHGVAVDVKKGGQGKSKLVGNINGGGERLKLRTSGGDIRVQSGGAAG